MDCRVRSSSDVRRPSLVGTELCCELDVGCGKAGRSIEVGEESGRKASELPSMVEKAMDCRVRSISDSCLGCAENVKSFEGSASLIASGVCCC